MSGPVQPTTIASARAVAIASDRVVDGRYQIVTTIASGGMGSVYLAVDLTLNRQVALKTLDRDLEQQSAWGRFEREASHLSRLNHPNIARIYDSGKLNDKMPYLIMELVHGQSLGDRLAKKGPLTSSEALCVFQGIAAALDYAHQFNIVHRDIKPANIMLTADRGGTISGAKLVDFGLAKSIDDQLFGQGFTSTGEILGSPFYMSPEQWNSEKVGASSDIYSLGVTLFEALTNRVPYRGDNVFATAMLHAKSGTPELSRYVEDEAIESIDDWQKIIDKMLGKTATDRYRSAAALRLDLARLSRSEYIEEFVDSDGDEACCDNSEKQGQIPAIPKIVWAAVCAICIIFTALISLLVCAPRRAHATIRANDTATAPPAHLINMPMTRKTLQVAHFVVSSHIDSSGDKVFNFPNPQAVGAFQMPSGMVSAIGEIKFKRGAEVDFYPNELMLLHPNLFVNFGNMLTQVHVQGCPVDFNDEGFRYIGEMNELTTVEIRNCSITKASIDTLNRLPKLKQLVLIDTEITGKDVLKLNRLRQLDSFYAGDFKDIRPVLQALTANPHLRTLILKADNLVDDDLKIIAAIPRIHDINISCNHDITSKGLAWLAASKSLRRLQFEHNHIEPSAIPTLAMFKGLKSLTLEWKNWTDAERAQLQHALPGCRIN